MSVIGGGGTILSDKDTVKIRINKSLNKTGDDRARANNFVLINDNQYDDMLHSDRVTAPYGKVKKTHSNLASYNNYDVSPNGALRAETHQLY